MKSTMAADHAGSSCYTAEDWQAQLEEVLALQSIFADEFRVTNIPGHNSACNPGTSTAADLDSGTSSSCNNSRSGPSTVSSSTISRSPEDLEQLIESLVGSEPPVTSPDDLLTFETLVHVILPDGKLQLVLDMQRQVHTAHCNNNSSSCAQGACRTSTHPSHSNTGDSSGMQVSFGPPISYLPPFCVQLTVPNSYPSSEQAPPKVVLQACWLSQQQEQQLQQQLQQLWQEQGPGPICFTWLDYLKYDALSALGLNKELVLQPQPQQQQQLAVDIQEQQLQEPAAAAHNSSCSGSCTAKDCSAVSSTTGDVPDEVTAAQGALSTAVAPFSPGESAGQQQRQSRQHQGRSRPRVQGGYNKQTQVLQQAVHPQHQQQHGGRHIKQQAAAADSRQQQQHTQQLSGDPQASNAVGTQQEQQSQQQQEHWQPEHEQAGRGLADQLQEQQTQMQAVEQLAVQLLRYSAAQEAEAFRESIQTCFICFEQVPGAECLQLPDCGHFYCVSCLKSHAAAQMEQGAVDNMRCPEPSCRRPFQPYIIKELLGDAGYIRWEDRLLQRTLDKMEDVVYCPRCDTVCIEDSDHCAQCSKCLYVFCSFCSDSWHPGSECLDPHERLRILERRKQATGAGDKRYEMDLVNQLMNLKYLNSCSRKCPSCGMATIKNEGCNKMTCVYCGANWCWKCQQVIQGYDHYKESRCNMFDQEEINRWNALMWANERAREVEMGQFAMQIRVQQDPAGVRLCRCPVCGQENLREGKNNLLRCWSCNCHFCHSCRSWLRGKVGQHFVGPRACKQHGD